ncbi:hypothetical protein EI74_0536 [Mycoplasma testudineum]|uniref:Uncharacterized protein n=1 Tax=Mycoplasma testudineum TaxID=244584 RepID=A0A4R6IE46_9MOLU|nr:hypothetical protein [Mycoplasma testudineum]OYD26761.1 hypothetical protein CG473_02285 [Mycoplasma testudineum]TDO19897.1 hypothetical protein EI74_0536 [Mycoplasma testudineum]
MKRKKSAFSFGKWLIKFVAQDSYLKGTIVLLFAAFLAIVSFLPSAVVISTAYGYTFGFLFGQFGLIIFIWWLFIGIKNLFYRQIQSAYYKQGSKFRKYWNYAKLSNYILVAIVVILFTLAIQSHVLFGNSKYENTYYFNWWMNEFTNYQYLNWMNNQETSAIGAALPNYNNFGLLGAGIVTAIGAIYNHLLLYLFAFLALGSVAIWFSRSYIITKFKKANQEKKSSKLNKQFEQSVPRLEKLSKKDLKQLQFGKEDESIEDLNNKYDNPHEKLSFPVSSVTQLVFSDSNHTAKIKSMTSTFDLLPNNEPNKKLKIETFPSDKAIGSQMYNENKFVTSDFDIIGNNLQDDIADNATKEVAISYEFDVENKNSITGSEFESSIESEFDVVGNSENFDKSSVINDQIDNDVVDKKNDITIQKPQNNAFFDKNNENGITIQKEQSNNIEPVDRSINKDLFKTTTEINKKDKTETIPFDDPFS